jgi:hypothetical protein
MRINTDTPPAYHLRFAPVMGNGHTVVTVVDTHMGETLHEGALHIHDDVERLAFADAAATAMNDDGAGNGIYVSLQRYSRQLPKTVRQLTGIHHAMRPVVIDKLAREGETINIIANPKMGKSWLAICLAICIAAGRAFLGRFACRQGRVLYVDNELHGETSAKRFPDVARELGLLSDDYADNLVVDNLRGRLKDLLTMVTYFDAIRPGEYAVIVLDAWYRFIPEGMAENDNGGMAQLYNAIDRHAERIGCCFVLIHHASKGNQSDKATTDVGAGAGTQSRAADCHLVIRDHEEAGAVVFDAAVRSFPPLQPFCARWRWPLFIPDDTLDPAALKRPPGRGGRPRKSELKEQIEEQAKTVWTPETFAATFVTDRPQTKDEIICSAKAKGLSGRYAEQLLGAGVAKGAVHQWKPGGRKPDQYANRPRTVTE